MCAKWSRELVFVSQEGVGFKGKKQYKNHSGDGKIKDLGGRIPRENELIGANHEFSTEICDSDSELVYCTVLK